MIIIKKEIDRKLYNSSSKQYINLSDVFTLINSGQALKIIDHNNKDITKEITKKAIAENTSSIEELSEVINKTMNPQSVNIKESDINSISDTQSLCDFLKDLSWASKVNQLIPIINSIYPNFEKTGTHRDILLGFSVNKKTKTKEVAIFASYKVPDQEKIDEVFRSLEESESDYGILFIAIGEASKELITQCENKKVTILDEKSANKVLEKM